MGSRPCPRLLAGVSVEFGLACAKCSLLPRLEHFLCAVSMCNASSSWSRVCCALLAGLLFSGFPPKNIAKREMLCRRLKYLEITQRLQVDTSPGKELRAEEAIAFLRGLSGVTEKIWPQKRMQSVWKLMEKYVCEGHPRAFSQIAIRQYSGKIEIKVSSSMHSFFFTAAVQDLFSAPRIRD